ncbi:ATP-binding cassette domain-containing protein [Saxibacter everestensis]|uniref:ATP-binding cassette domain-containing protein n=1 Tax=Saxibacter everestensis TaxID=2909229 RepID=A0ABY8QVQ1_9MICO|nr:ATP-binding cassette domain-containing protein [Brevibacteriaceae bacterium ZFBP1038]
MGYIDVNNINFRLGDGSPLLSEVSFTVGDGVKAALIGPNGTGKTTLLRLIAGDLPGQDGAVTRRGGLGVMRQFIGQLRDDSTVRDLLIDLAPAAIRDAARALDAAELELMATDDEPTQLRYAQAIADWGDAGGYEQETVWSKVTMAAFGLEFDECRWRAVNTLSGGQQKRLALEALFTGPDECLLLDEPDNFLDVPAKRWLEDKLRNSKKTVLFVSHDRELLSNAASRIITLEPGAAGARSWVHGGGFGTYRAARDDRNSRLEELRRRWDEEHAKLRELVQMYKQKAAYNSDMAARYQAAQTRLRRFVDEGPPEVRPPEQSLKMRLRGGRTGKRAIVCQNLQLLGLGTSHNREQLRPFDLEVFFGDRVAVLGPNGTGKSHLIRLLAAGGSDPDIEHRPVGDIEIAPVEHSGTARLGARVRPGWFAQTHAHPELVGRTLLEILHRGDEHRNGMAREAASRALDRYGLAHAAERSFEHLSGGQQARFQILLLELSGATLLLLDEPTDNLDLDSAEALERALDFFEGTVVAVTHDRWFARDFDRFLYVGSDGNVRETAEALWDGQALV